MKIHQLSASYDAEQDRILLRINTHEGTQLSLWLTRRLLGQWWPQMLAQDEQVALNSIAAHSPQAAQAYSAEARQELASVKRERALKNTDFKTPFVAAEPKKQNEPLLVTEVSMRLLEAQAEGGEPQLEVHFEEVLAQGSQRRGVNFHFTSAIYHGLIAVLKQAVGFSGWAEMTALCVPTEGQFPGFDDPAMHVLH